jgi:hypothetical protein
MTTGELARAKAEIQKSYLEQIGDTPQRPLVDLALGMGPRATASRARVLPPTGSAQPAPPVAAQPPLVTQPAPTRPGPPVAQEGLRGEAQAVLRQFHAERDPAKKAALAQRLRALRAQLVGTQ